MSLHGPKYNNRELSWLEFNHRVLEEARDPDVPVLDRLKFLSITASNLDEFFMKRIGGLKHLAGAGLNAPTVDGRTPQQQIEECETRVAEALAEEFQIPLETASRDVSDFMTRLKAMQLV